MGVPAVPAVTASPPRNNTGHILDTREVREEYGAVGYTGNAGSHPPGVHSPDSQKVPAVLDELVHPSASGAPDTPGLTPPPRGRAQAYQEEDSWGARQSGSCRRQRQDPGGGGGGQGCEPCPGVPYRPGDHGSTCNAEGTGCSLTAP